MEIQRVTITREDPSKAEDAEGNIIRHEHIINVPVLVDIAEGQQALDASTKIGAKALKVLADQKVTLDMLAILNAGIKAKIDQKQGSIFAASLDVVKAKRRERKAKIDALMKLEDDKFNAEYDRIMKG